MVESCVRGGAGIPHDRLAGSLPTVPGITSDVRASIPWASWVAWNRPLLTAALEASGALGCADAINVHYYFYRRRVAVS